MQTSAPHVDGLRTLSSLSDAQTRRAVFLQSLASLGAQEPVEAELAFGDLTPDALREVVRQMRVDGFFEDPGSLGSPLVAGGAYDLANALPLGEERLDLARRVLAELYRGGAPTFVTVARRMALGSARGLTGAGIRARTALSLALPIASEVQVDALALSLASRRDLASAWITDRAVGSLPERRLAARILERAAREAERRVLDGDAAAARIFRSLVPVSATEALAGVESRVDDAIGFAWRALLEDRETLVWRHVAVARGLLAGTWDKLAEEIDDHLTAKWTPTEWRRAATSLVASAAVHPDTAVAKAMDLLRGPLVDRDPGILVALAWGLPDVAMAQPDAADELIIALTEMSPIAMAEPLLDLRREVPAAGEAAVATCAEALAQSLETEEPDEGLAALARAIEHDLGREMMDVPPEDLGSAVMVAIRAAMDCYALEDAEVAHGRALEALAIAQEAVGVLESLEYADGPRQREEGVPLVRGLDGALLESGVLDQLLLLDRRGTQERSRVGELDELRGRLGKFLLSRERHEHVDTATHATVHQRQLRALLHLVDAETTELEEDPARQERVRTTWRDTARDLLTRLDRDRGSPLRRAIAATIGRALDALVRDGAIEAADALLFAAAHARAADIVEILSEASRNPEVKTLLGAYARLMRGVDSERGDTAPSRPRRGDVRALSELPVAFPSAASSRTDALGGALARLARGVEALSEARSLAALVATEEGAVVAFEAGANLLLQLTAGALGRFDARDDDAPSSQATLPHLLGAIADALEAKPGAEISLGAALDRWIAELARSAPPHIALVCGEAVGYLRRLPLSAQTGDAGPMSMPQWLPQRRTIGGFYVERPLGRGAGGSVFVVTRADERDDPEAERFALKVPEYKQASTPMMTQASFLKLFREEARALLALPEHENLARFVTFDAGSRPKPILVMELIKGASCEDLLSERALTVGTALDILAGVAAGLGSMHALGIGHLDLKPANVILRADHTPVLVDFGLSGRKLRPGCGTGCYASPEVWGAANADVAAATPMAADVYAFGCFAYEVMTAKTLFDAPTEMALISAHLSHDGEPPPIKSMSLDARLAPLAALVRGCIRRNPQERLTIGAATRELDALRARYLDARWPL